MNDRSQHGFAVPVAVFALVIVGILVTAGFYVARQESQIGASSERGALAFYLAERGIGEVLENWGAAYAGMTAWSDTISVSETLDEGTVDVDVTRLANRLYFVDATSTVTQGGYMYAGATRRIGLVVRNFSAQLTPPAALTTRGDVSVRGTAEVHGGDQIPPGWEDRCPVPDGSTDKIGVLTDGSGDVGTQGAGEITGNPPISVDPDIDDDTFKVFGDFTWDDLVGMADKHLPGGIWNNTGQILNPNGTCNFGHARSWGSPTIPDGPCSDWFPIIYINGTVRVESGGGEGQGILLVEGDMDLRGNFFWYGIIITQGRFETQGSGNRVVGGVMASNADLLDEKLVGGSVVQHSTCAADAALDNPGLNRMRPLAQRSWVDLSTASLR